MWPQLLLRLLAPLAIRPLAAPLSLPKLIMLLLHRCLAANPWHLRRPLCLAAWQETPGLPGPRLMLMMLPSW